MEQNKDQIGAAVRGEAVAEFNINDMMIVTLTEFGAQIWNSRYDDIPIPAHLIPKPVLAGHVLKDQMWDLMKTFGPHIHLGGEMPFLKAIMAHEKVSARDADAPSEPSELPTQAMYGMQWPEGYVADLNGKITPPKGRVNDFNFGYDNGYADGLQSIKDTVANIGAQAVVKSRAADAPSEPSESLCAAVMNIPCARTMSHFVRVPEMVAYKEGHRDALCAVIDVIAAVKSRAADALDNQPSPVQPDYDALRRTIHELRTYSPAGDAYHGAHIHKVWADAIEAAICEPALVDAITRLDSQPTELPAEKRVVSVWDDLAFREAVLRVNEAVRADEDDPIEKHAEEVIEATRALAVYVDNQIDNATDSSQPTEPDGCAKCRHTYCMSGEVCKACGDVAMQGWKGGRQPTDGGVRNG